ncbi:MAG: hypothetical protein Kow0090_13280 [Myxococcota bacterium]
MLPIVLLKESSGELDECKRELERFIEKYKKTDQAKAAREELSFIEEFEHKPLEGKDKAVEDILKAVDEHNIKVGDAAAAKVGDSEKADMPINTAGLRSKLNDEFEELWLTAKKTHLSYRAYYRANSHYISNPIHLGLIYDKTRYKITTIPFQHAEHGYQGYNAEIVDIHTRAFVNIDYKGNSKLVVSVADYLSYLKKGSAK